MSESEQKTAQMPLSFPTLAPLLEDPSVVGAGAPAAVAAVLLAVAGQHGVAGVIPAAVVLAAT